MAVGASAIRAGRAFVELLADDKGLRGGLDRAGQRLAKWGASMNAAGLKMLAAGTAIVAPLAAASKVFAEMGDKLAKASARTGVGVEALSALAYAAEQSGSSLEDLETGLRKMQKTIVEAAKGSDEANAALARIGLTVDDLKGLKPDEQFVTIADALSKVQDPALKAATAMDIFGKGGAGLIPLMADGADGINELVARAKELGLVWSTEDAKAAEEFGDRMDDMWKVLKRGVSLIGSAVMPVLRKAAVAVMNNALIAMRWVDSHREVIRTALKVGLAITAAGAAFVGIGAALATLGVYTRAASVAFGAVSSVVSGVGSVLRVALFSGIGLVLTSLGALAAYFVYTSGVGQRVVGALAGYFSELGAIAGETIQGIFDAITAGRWDLAVKILMEGMKAEWFAGIAPLRTAWAELTGWITKKGNDIAYGAAMWWDDITRDFQDAWTETTAVFSTAWEMFASKVKQVWEGVQSWLTDKWLKLGNLIGLVSDAELEAAQQLNDKQSQSTVGDAIAKETAAIKAGADALRKYREKSAADRQAAREQYATDLQRANQAATDQTRAAEEQARKAADAARAALADSTGSAARFAREAGGNAPTFKPPTIDDLQGGLDSLMRKVSVRGTFNSAALQGLQSGPVDRIAKATEATATNTAKLAKKDFGRRPSFTS